LERLHTVLHISTDPVVRAGNDAPRRDETREESDTPAERNARKREGEAATRKVRAKRFVECFMKSFRIVDFLCLPRSRLAEFMARPMYAREACTRARVLARAVPKI
jgi:hypothetical protein